MLLSKEEIEALATDGPKCHYFEIRAWSGKEVCLRELDGLQALEWDTAQLDRHKNPGVSTTQGTGAEHLVQLCLVDESTKQPMFSSKDRITTIRNLGGALQEIFNRCLEINRLRSVDLADTEKKSSETPNSDSSVT